MNDKAVNATRQIAEKKQDIKYSTREYVVGYLYDQFKEDEYYIPREYQRNFVWKKKDQCYFIESVLMGLPIPYMFFADTEDGRTEIVDGAQRISTIVAFIDNELRLEGLEILTEANGLYYKDLEQEIQRRFVRTNFRVVYLEEGTTVSIRQEIFKRINISGSKLKSSEVRRGSYEGPFTDLTLQLANDKRFKEMAALSESAELRYDGMELVTRFFAYTDNYPALAGYDGKVTQYLDKYTEQMNAKFTEEPELMEEYKATFLKMVKYAYACLGNRGFRKTASARSTPHARFEALAVGIGVAQKKNPDLPGQNMIEWIDNEDFLDIVRSDAANNKSKLIARINYVEKKLLSTTK